MNFWGLEVQPGKTVKVDPGENRYLHLSQVSLGEIKNDEGNEGIPIFVKFENKKLVLGTLSADKCFQIPFDLVFEKEFELSNGSKNTKIYFSGYKASADSDDEDSESEYDEEDHQLAQILDDLGKSELKDEKTKLTAGKPNALKADASVVKPKAKVDEPKKDDKQKADDDDDSDESEDDESDDDEDMLEGEDKSDDEDEDESSDEEEEATPKRVETSSKRPAGSASKTPILEKKAKLISPVGNQKTGVDGKKGGHIATPHPAKQGKTPANSDKSKKQSPKSSGTAFCKSCSKTFNSGNALQGHLKAKHGAGK